MKSWIIAIIGAIAGALIGFLSALLLEKIKFNHSNIKCIRIMALDCEIPEKVLERLNKDLKKSLLLNGINILMDGSYLDERCFYHDSLDEKKIISKESTKNIDGYDGKKRKVYCWNEKRLLKEICLMNKNEEIGVVALTTIPIYSKEFSWTNSSDHEKINLKETKIFKKLKNWIFKQETRICLFSYDKKTFKKEGSMLRVVEHQIAHLLGMDNYNFFC